MENNEKDDKISLGAVIGLLFFYSWTILSRNSL